MSIRAVPAWHLRIGWTVLPERGGTPRRITGIRLEGIPPIAVAQFACGSPERYPRAG